MWTKEEEKKILTLFYKKKTPNIRKDARGDGNDVDVQCLFSLFFFLLSALIAASFYPCFYIETHSRLFWKPYDATSISSKSFCVPENVAKSQVFVVFCYCVAYGYDS